MKNLAAPMPHTSLTERDMKRLDKLAAAQTNRRLYVLLIVMMIVISQAGTVNEFLQGLADGMVEHQ
jgi:hypothetical protein